MRKLNKYFFETEEVAMSDVLWFYGGIVAMITIGVIGLWH